MEREYCYLIDGTLITVISAVVMEKNNFGRFAF